MRENVLTSANIVFMELYIDLQHLENKGHQWQIDAWNEEANQITSAEGGYAQCYRRQDDGSQ